MIKTCTGFMLLEAILTVVIVSICLTFITRSLLTNFYTGVRFQRTIRSLVVMENRLNVLCATNGSEDQLVNATASPLNSHLKKIELLDTLQGHIDITTIIYNQ